jgi:hypothetical protein
MEVRRVGGTVAREEEASTERLLLVFLVNEG